MNKKISIMIIIVLLFSFAFPTLNSIATDEIRIISSNDAVSPIAQDIVERYLASHITNLKTISGYTDIDQINEITIELLEEDIAMYDDLDSWAESQLNNTVFNQTMTEEEINEKKEAIISEIKNKTNYYINNYNSDNKINLVAEIYYKELLEVVEEEFNRKLTDVEKENMSTSKLKELMGGEVRDYNIDENAYLNDEEATQIIQGKLEELLRGLGNDTEETVSKKIEQLIRQEFEACISEKLNYYSNANSFTEENKMALATMEILGEMLGVDTRSLGITNMEQVNNFIQNAKTQLTDEAVLDWMNNRIGLSNYFTQDEILNNSDLISSISSEYANIDIETEIENVKNNKYENAIQEIDDGFNKKIQEIKRENGQEITNSRMYELLIAKRADQLSEYLGDNYESDFTEDEIEGLTAHLDNLLIPYNISSEELSQMRTLNILDTIGLVVDPVLSLLTYPLKVVIFILPGLILTAVATGVSNLGGNYDGVLTIDKLLFNEIPLTSIDIFNKDVENNVLSELRSNIANWYYVLRNLSIIIALCVLIYIGIRMAMASMAEPKAKYKKLLKDWCVGIILIFALHYIIIGVITLNNALVSVLADVQRSSGAENMLGKLLGDSFKVFSDGFLTSFATAAIYLMFVGMTFAFLIMYIKRMITISFLIVIAPLITVTYAIDKANDGKAQALDTWLKEFIYNVLIQPFHCIIYLSLVSGVYELLQDASAGLAKFVIAIMMMMFLFKAENIVRSIFGFSRASSLGTAVKSMAGVMAGYKLAQNITGKATGAVGKHMAEKNKLKLKENTAPESKGTKIAKKIGRKAVDIYANPKVIGAITSATLGAASGDASTSLAAGYAGYTAGEKIEESFSGSKTVREVKDKKDKTRSEYEKLKTKNPSLDDKTMQSITSSILKADDIKKVKDEYKPYAKSVYSLRDKFKDAGIENSEKEVMEYVKWIEKSGSSGTTII